VSPRHGLSTAFEDHTGLRRRLAQAHRQILAYARDIKTLLHRLRAKEQELDKAEVAQRFYTHQMERSLKASEQRAAELEAAHLDTIFRLLQATTLRDSETGIHLRRIASLAELVAWEVGLGREEARCIAEASKLHDIGKIGIEDAILRKNGPLTSEQWVIMHQHTVIGAELLSGSPSPLLQRAERIALHHHECWDGTGYPYGLRGEEIPLEARIVMLCDQYDALRSVRPYKPAYEHAAVCDILLNGDGKTRPQHFDPQLLKLFRHLQPRFEEIWNEVRHDEEMALKRCA